MTFKTMLKVKGVTQKELAEKVGVSTECVYKWCKGGYKPTLYNLAKIENVLNVPINTLFIAFQETDDEKKNKEAVSCGNEAENAT